MGTANTGSGSAEFFRAISYGYIKLTGRGKAYAPTPTSISQFRATIDSVFLGRLAAFPASFTSRFTFLRQYLDARIPSVF